MQGEEGDEFLLKLFFALKYSTSITWIDAFVLVWSWLSGSVPVPEQAEERRRPLEVSVRTEEVPFGDQQRH